MIQLMKINNFHFLASRELLQHVNVTVEESFISLENLVINSNEPAAAAGNMEPGGCLWIVSLT